MWISLSRFRDFKTHKLLLTLTGGNSIIHILALFFLPQFKERRWQEPRWHPRGEVMVSPRKMGTFGNFQVISRINTFKLPKMRGKCSWSTNWFEMSTQQCVATVHLHVYWKYTLSHKLSIHFLLLTWVQVTGQQSEQRCRWTLIYCCLEKEYVCVSVIVASIIFDINEEMWSTLSGSEYYSKF